MKNNSLFNPITLIVIIIIISSIIFISILPIVKASDCCINNDGTCVQDYGPSECSAGSFRNMGCANVQEVTIEEKTITNPCLSGCCCANENAPNPNDHNSADDSELLMTNASCQLGFNTGDYQGDYYFATKSNTQQSQTCADVCSGTGGGQTYSVIKINVSGTVKNSNNDPVENAAVSIPVPGSQYSAITDDKGKFTIIDLETPVIDGTVQEWQGMIIASKEDCDDVDTKYETFSRQNINNEELTLDCEGTCTEEPPTSEITSSNKIILTTTFGNDCNPTLKIKEKINGKVKTIKTRGSNSPDIFTIENPLPSTKYCFIPELVFGTSKVVGEEVCTTTGDSECLTDPVQESCDNNYVNDNGETVSAKNTCDDTEHLITTPCDEGEVCVMNNNEPVCVIKPDCQACNGLFGMLGDLNLFKVLIPVYGSSYNCNAGAVNNYCFLDSNNANNMYKSCSKVDSCEKYISKTACEDDPCGLKDCKWKNIKPELGIGVCQTITKPDCQSCDSAFGACSKELCAQLGTKRVDGQEVHECYYDESNSNEFPYEETSLETFTPRCLSKELNPCAFYDNKEDCIGKGNNQRESSMDQQTNVRTPSNDFLSIGTCQWDSENKRCFSNADDKTDQLKRDDPRESGIYMNLPKNKKIPSLVDNQPPKTILDINQEIALHNLPNTDIITNDNFYNESDIITRFCFGENCYPDKNINELTTSITLDVGETKDYTLRYFSYDPSGNYEEVNQTSISITNYGYPILLRANVE